MYDNIDQNHAFLQIFEMNSGRSQCVTSSELLRSEEEQEEEGEEKEDKHYVIEITFDEVDDDVGDNYVVDYGEDWGGVEENAPPMKEDYIVQISLMRFHIQHSIVVEWMDFEEKWLKQLKDDDKYKYNDKYQSKDNDNTI